MGKKRTVPLSILYDPRRNRGTAFTRKERRKYGLEGILPDAVESMDTQILRVTDQLDALEHPIQKYIYLSGLLDVNERLFYRAVGSDPAKFLPLVYTPTVGEACERMGHIARRPRGLFVSYRDRKRIGQILRNWPARDVRFVVVTDGQRILGLGDLGVGGIGISIGKLTLYTSCAGVPPELALPVVLDVGTDNEKLRADPLYPGLRRPRVRGKAYDDFVDAFVNAVVKRFPKVCIQWEDFAGVNAIRILARHRIKAARDRDAVGLAGVHGRADGRQVEPEADALRPHVGDEFVEVEAGREALGVGIGRVGQPDGFEVVFRIAAPDLDGAVQRAARRVERLDVGREAHDRRAVGPAREFGTVAEQRLHQHGIIDAGEVATGTVDVVDRGDQRGPEHGGIGIHAVVAFRDAMLWTGRGDASRRYLLRGRKVNGQDTLRAVDAAARAGPRQNPASVSCCHLKINIKQLS